jgi:hypothetical protein
MLGEWNQESEYCCANGRGDDRASETSSSVSSSRTRLKKIFPCKSPTGYDEQIDSHESQAEFAELCCTSSAEHEDADPEVA